MTARIDPAGLVFHKDDAIRVDTINALVAVLHAALKLDACGPDRDSSYAEFLEEFDRFREALAPFKEAEQ